MAYFVPKRFWHVAQQAGQHIPLVVVGIVSGFAHIVGKHQTSLHCGIALGLPPWSPVAPFATASILMSGFTQYGQQCPGTDTWLKPAGQVSAPQEMLAQGSLMAGARFAFTWTSILVRRSRSSATSHWPCSRRRLDETCNALMSLLAFTCLSL